MSTILSRPQCVNVRGQSYLSLTTSISWLLMPWLLPLPGHQQPWYWQSDYVKYVGPGLIRGRISTIYGMSVWRNDIKYKYMFMFPLENLACKELTKTEWDSEPWATYHPPQAAAIQTRPSLGDPARLYHATWGRSSQSHSLPWHRQQQ